MILYQNGNTYRNMIVKQKAIIAQFVSFNSFSVIGSFLIELKIYIKREPFLISLFFFKILFLAEISHFLRNDKRNT